MRFTSGLEVLEVGGVIVEVYERISCLVIRFILYFKMAAPLPSLGGDKYSPSPPMTGGSPSPDPEKDYTHEPDDRANSERSSSITNHKEPKYSEHRECKQIGFAPGTKEPPQSPHEYYSRDIKQRSFFTAFSRSLYPREIYGEFDCPSGALRYLGAIGIKPESERTKVGKVNLAVMMRMYLSTIRRDLVIFASRCENKSNSSLECMNHEGMIEAGKLLETYCKLAYRNPAL